MNIKEIIPEYFHAAFEEYSRLETDEQRALFWENRPERLDKETYEAEYLKGLQLLRNAVEDLGRRINAAVEV